MEVEEKDGAGKRENRESDEEGVITGGEGMKEGGKEWREKRGVKFWKQKRKMEQGKRGNREVDVEGMITWQCEG